MSTSHSSVMERRSPGNPFPKSPMPRSPFPKSPMPRSPDIYEKYKSRCAYGFISFFHFRQKQSKKLISDQRTLKRRAIGNEHSNIRLHLASNAEGKQQRIADGVQHKPEIVDSGKAAKEKIMSENMHIQQQIEKIPTAKVEHVKSKCGTAGDQSTDRRKAGKSSRRARRLPIYGCYDVATMKQMKPDDQNSVGRSTDKNFSEGTETSLSSQVHSSRGRDSNSETMDHHHEINIHVQMNEAAEAFINQKLIDGKHLSRDGAKEQSKHFMDALETLNSNKDLFIKLLQDPDSLLVKHIEDLRDFQVKKQHAKSSTEATSTETPTSKKTNDEERMCSQNFTSSDSNVSRGTDGPQILENIVVLKPDSTGLRNCAHIKYCDPSQVEHGLSSVQQSVRPAFLPFAKMKRLIHAMGVSQKNHQLRHANAAVRTTYDFQGSEKCGKQMAMEKVDRNSPEKTFSEYGSVGMSSMDVKKGNQMGKIMVGEDVSSYNKVSQKNSSLPNVGLSNGNTYFLRKQKPNNWDRTDSIPEYDFLPLVGNRKKGETDFVATQMRFSHYGSNEMVGKIKQGNQRENRNRLSSPQMDVDASTLGGYEKQGDQAQLCVPNPNILDKISSDVTAYERISSPDNESGPFRLMEIIKKIDGRMSEESTSAGVTSNDDGSNDVVDEGSCAVNDSPEADQSLPSSTEGYLSSPSSLEQVHGIKDKAEQPSPVSVLENFLVEDITSPSSTESQLAESSGMPIQIAAEEDCLIDLFQSTLNLKINPSNSFDEHQTKLEYIRAILRASGFYLDELLLKCQLSEQHLRQTCGDHKLLTDYFVEVLVEIYRHYFGCCPRGSLTRPRTRPITESLVHQVMKKVDQNLLVQPPFRTLEQLAEKDLIESGIWMDTRVDVEDMVSEMVEGILDQVLMETTNE